MYQNEDVQPGQPARSFESSDTFAKLAIALAKAQAEMTEAERSGTNPDLGKSYATLADLRKACIPYLAKHELSLIQIPKTATNLLEVKTILMHSSGEWIASTLHVTSASPMTVWAIGSGITYLRRYGMGSMACVASEAEDDGVAMQKPGAGPAPPPMQPDRFPVPQQSRTNAVREKLAGKAAETAATKQAVPPSPKAQAEASKPAAPPQPKPGESPPAAAPPKQEPPPAIPPAAPPEPATQPTPAPAPASAAGQPVADNIKQIQDWLKAIGEVRKREAFITITMDFKKQADSGAFDKGQVNAILAALKAKGYEMAKYFINAATTGQQLEQAEQLCDLTFTQSDPQVGELSSMLAAKLSDLKKKG
jgi:hypothetical protein